MGPPLCIYMGSTVDKKNVDDDHGLNTKKTIFFFFLSSSDIKLQTA